MMCEDLIDSRLPTALHTDSHNYLSLCQHLVNHESSNYRVSQNIHIFNMCPHVCKSISSENSKRPLNQKFCSSIICVVSFSLSTLAHLRKMYKEVIILTPVVFTQLLPNQILNMINKTKKLRIFWSHDFLELTPFATFQTFCLVSFFSRKATLGLALSVRSFVRPSVRNTSLKVS